MNTKYYIFEQFIACLFTVFATLFSFHLKRKIFDERIERDKEFVKLVNQVSYVLDMYADLYTNVFDMQDVDGKLKEKILEGEYQVRKVALEFRTFINLNNQKEYLNIKRENIKEACSYLIGLSNSFCIPNGISEHRYSIINDNSATSMKIKELLNISND